MRTFKLRTFILSTTVAVVALALGVFFGLAKSGFQTGFAKLDEIEIKQASEVLAASFRVRRTELENLGLVISSDNDLSSKYILSKETKDFHLITQKLTQIRSTAKLDVVNIIDIKGKQLLSTSIDWSEVSKIAMSKVGVSIQRVGGRLLMIVYAPLKLYGDIVGRLVIGNYLDSVVSKEIQSFTRVKVQFKSKLDTKISSNEEAVDALKKNNLEIELQPNLSAIVTLKSGASTASQVRNAVNRRFILMGAISLLIVALVIFLIFDYGFIREFNQLTNEVRNVSLSLDHGVFKNIERYPSAIYETEILSQSFVSLGKSLLRYNLALEAKTISEQEAKQHQLIAKVASQVAHDIRSPLAALSVLERDLVNLDEDKRIMLRSAVNRIKDIANNLLEKNREAIVGYSIDDLESTSKEKASSQLLVSLLDSIVSEKRLQYRAKLGVGIDNLYTTDAYDLFALVQPIEFKRVISNLINNSVEALEDKGTVNLKLNLESNNTINVQIIDSGRGISPEIIARLGELGETHGKSDGMGLGLYHARKCAECWGGKLNITSMQGRGTVVTLTIPSAKPPEWFLSSLSVKQVQNIVILDDDDTIHKIWIAKFESLISKKNNIKINHFSNPNEFSNWVKTSPDALSALYLMDFELLGFDESGLDLIKKYDLGKQSILVTSRFQEIAIQESCKSLGLKLIPKGMVGLLPLQII